MKPSNCLGSLLLAAGSSLLAISSASAQSWSGATNGDWLTTTNWTGGVAAGSTTSSDTDIAVFNVNANNTVSINMTTTGGVYYLGAIDNTNATARIIQNTSGTTGVLTLNGATVNSVANTILRNSTSTLLTIGNAASGTLGLALGNVTTNVIQITGTGGITINSNISGVGGITRQGSGTGILTLSGNNSYTGVTAISTGIIAISSNNALGSTAVGSHTTIAATGASNGARLQLSGNITSAENITITGATEASGFNGAIRNTSGNNTLSGDIVLSSPTNGIRFDTAAGTLTFSGNISQTGAGGQTLALTPAASSTITINNPIANKGGQLLTGASGATGTAGTVILKGVNATDGTGIGNTLVFQGSTLQLGVSGALNTTGNLSVSADTSQTATFNLASFNQTINALSGGGTNANLNSRLVINSVAGTSILTVGNGGGSGTFNGQINTGTGNIQLIKTGAGNQTLSGNNSYTGGTRIDNGILTLGHATDTLANTGAVNVNGGTLALGANSDTVGAVTLTSGSITGSGAGTLTGTGSAYDVRSGSVSAKLGGSVGLTKTTAGTVTLSGVNAYSGATAVNGGRLTIDNSGSINSSSSVTIAGGALRYNASTNLATTVTFTSGTLEGTNWNGNLSGLTIGSGQTISPGNSPGTASTGSQTWAGSGSYLFEINNATGGAGADPGWDLLSGTGTLDITATSGSPFNILLTSLTLGNIAGDAVNFSDATSYNWLFADFVNPITGYASDRFFVNTTAFDNTFTGTFGVALGDTIGGGDNTQLYLTYTPIPEPRAALLGGLGMLMLLRRRRS